MRIGLLVPVVMLLAGCMDMPQPFRHQGAVSDLARPPLLSDQDDAAPVRPLVRLAPFSGLPGDGNQSLYRAVKAALEQRGVLVAAEGGNGVVTAQFKLLPGGDGRQTLMMTWQVTSHDGAAWGQASQQGPVETTRIQGPWGRLAHDIAQGSADGIVEIVRSAFTNMVGD